MITNFEEITSVLTDDDKRFLPCIIKGLSRRTKENPVKAPEIVKGVNANVQPLGLPGKLTEPRLRKLCNHIRSNAMLPLISTSQGYYVSTDPTEIRLQIVSLKERADAIMNAARGLEIYMKKHGI